MSADRSPTPTSFALLGLLAIRPWSSYELAKLMGRALHVVLPRAESNVYAEVKRLVADGLATARREAVGRRGRTVYTITDAGRDALGTWLTTPARPTLLEAEALLKVLFAEHLPPDELRAHIVRFGEEADEARGSWAALAQEYLEDRGPFPERLHVNTLFWVFAARYARMRVEWARWAADVVASWPDADGPGAEAIKVVLGEELRAADPRPAAAAPEPASR